MYEILYGWFEENKNWLFQLEEAVMTLENWQYTEESVVQAEANKRTQGKRIKGCGAQLIAYVKVDQVNQICDSGVKKHGMNITKSRPKEEMLTMLESGKYVRRKKGQIFLSEKMSQKQDVTNDNNNAENNKHDESPVAPPMTDMECEPAYQQPICTTENNEDIATAASTATKDKGNQLMVRKNLRKTQQKISIARTGIPGK